MHATANPGGDPGADRGDAGGVAGLTPLEASVGVNVRASLRSEYAFDNMTGKSTFPNG